MQTIEPIFWHQGLFLQPQHFQMLDMNINNMFLASLSINNQYAWGIDSCVIDTDALSRGVVSVRQLSAIFQDGTIVNIPNNAICHGRNINKIWTDKDKPINIYAGIKRLSEKENVAVIQNVEDIEKCDNRFAYNQTIVSQKDIYMQDAPDANLKKMSYVIKIFLESEIENSTGYSLMPIARLVFLKNEIIADNTFSYPIYNIQSAVFVNNIIESIKDALYSRSKQLGEFKSPKTLKEANLNTNYFFYVFALQTINKYLPVLKIYFDNKTTHPYNIFIVLAQLIGELSIFTDRIDALGRMKNGNELLGRYNHLNPYQTFESARLLILELLDALVIGPEYLIPFIKNGENFLCNVENSIFEANCSYYLVIKSASSYESIYNDFQEINKIGPKENIEMLINRALPGIDVSMIDNQPLGLPKKEDIKYLKLNVSSPLWLEVKRYQNITVYYDGVLDDVEIQLAVIKG